MAGPLEGLSVIEMAGLGPCPLAGQLLADLGADVIVVDRETGPADSTDVNRRGKRSIVLDLKNEVDRDRARALIDQAGIVIEGFRPGVMERLGLCPKDLGKHVIFGRITGWGQTGPLSRSAGHDINYLGLTGALAAMGNADAPPPPPLNLVADYAGGTMFLLLGILSAVFERHKSGRGQIIDAAMVDGVPALMGLFYTFLARHEWMKQRNSNSLDGGAPFYRTYRTRDQKFVSVGPLEPQFHALLLEKADLPTEHAHSQSDRRRWAERSAEYEAVFATKTRDEWCAIFDGTDACVAPVLDFDEAPYHPHFIARETFLQIDGVMQAAIAPRFSRSIPPTPRGPTPRGSQTTEIISQIDEIRAR